MKVNRKEQNRYMNKKSNAVLIIFLVLALIIGGAAIYFTIAHKALKQTESQRIEENVTVFECESVSEVESEPENEQETDIVTDLLSDSEVSDSDDIEKEESLIADDAILLSDIYTEVGNNAKFKCFDKDACDYTWEIYDVSVKNWIVNNDDEIETDELQREVSVLTVNANAIQENDELMVKCTVHYPDREDFVQTASLFLLEDVKDIEFDEIIVDADTYICAKDLSVKVIYESGRTETVTGLENLFFLSTEETRDVSSTVSGNRIETITTVNKESNYLKIGMEEKEVCLRYHSNPDAVIDVNGKITGEDQTAPIISDVKISPYDIKNVDESVVLTVSIEADDDCTPYPYLEYAFVLTEPSDGDWGRKNTFDVKISKNGTYLACCRDTAGNISTKEVELITVDTRAPVVSVALENNNEWCQYNLITVNAEDSCPLSYRYLCADIEMDTGWISFDTYTVTQNGTYTIQVQDAAGNITETDISINNIDSDMPVIRLISEKKE